MLEVRDRKCREFYGDDAWDKADPKSKACFDFLCGNHTRNLPVVRFNKVNIAPILRLIILCSTDIFLPLAYKLRPTISGFKQN